MTTVPATTVRKKPRKPHFSDVEPYTWVCDFCGQVNLPSFHYCFMCNTGAIEHVPTSRETLVEALEQIL